MTGTCSSTKLFSLHDLYWVGLRILGCNFSSTDLLLMISELVVKEKYIICIVCHNENVYLIDYTDSWL